MTGFDDKALILLPWQSTYDTKNGNYTYTFRQGLNNLIFYLNMIGMQPYGLYTDDLMRALRPDGVKLVSTLTTADSFWASKHCDDMQDALSMERWEDEKLIVKVTADAATAKGMSEEDRFQLLLKHEHKISAAYIASFKVVIIFNYPNRMNYKATSKPGDEKIRIYIDANTLIPQTYIGGAQINPCDLLAVPYASRALNLWEVL